MWIVFSVIVLGYFFSISVYRLCLSPVASFPGPRLAALTFWFEFYYDVILKGRYAWKIQELHKQYGPIIRVNPEELHIDDPSFYDQIYTGPSRRTNKWPWSARMFGTSMAAVGTVDHDLHRLRRSTLNPFFSKKGVVGLEPIIQTQIDKLCQRLAECKGTGQIVNLSDALTCLSADVISDCAFGETYGLLGAPNFAPDWRKFMMQLSLGTHLMKQFGRIYQIAMSIAPWFPPLVHALSRRLEKLRRSLASQIETIRQTSKNPVRIGHKTFFHALLEGDLSAAEKSTARLTDEALTIIGAGTITTAQTLALALFHVLSNRRVANKVHNELQTFYTSGKSASWTGLNQLPYLTATITESLRLSFGVSHRLQRISPDLPLQYKEWTIPPGTPVSMTQMFIMTDPKLFPRPNEFLPERWLADELPSGFPPVAMAKKFFVPFSRGTRSCVGMNLAYAESFLTIGALLRPIDAGGKFYLELFDTSKRDFEVAYDWFNPCPPLDSKGLRVLVT